MDYTTELENVKNELRGLGFTEDKLNQLMELAAEEAIDAALLDLQDVDESTLNQLNTDISADTTSSEDAFAKINKVFTTAYGPQAESKKQELLYNYLKDTLNQTKQAKDIFNRYQAGDPSAVAFVKSQEGNPDVQKIIDMM